MAIVDAYLHALYRSPDDFVYSVTRNFVRACQTPMFVMPSDTPAHPYAVSMEIVRLAPNAEVARYPWKEPKDLIPHYRRKRGSATRCASRANAPVSPRIVEASGDIVDS